MTAGNIAAVTQSNVKRMLAYSSIAHAGYLLIGVVAGTPRGVTAMLVYLLIYAFMQLGAFAVIVHAAPQRRAVGDELKDFSGLAFRNPFAAFAMLLFMLSLGGIPPTAGFMGKFWLFSAAIDSGYYVAGGDRRAQQRDLALLLRPHRRLHVSEEGDDRLGAGDQPRRWRSCWRSAVAATLLLGRLSAAAVRGGRRVRADARRRAAFRPRHSLGFSAEHRPEFARLPAGEVFHKVRYSQWSLVELCGMASMSADQRYPAGSGYSGIGLELAGATAGLALLGYWIDGHFGTRPWGIIGGVIIGLVGGLYNLVKESLNAVREAQEDDAASPSRRARNETLTGDGD